MYVQMDQQYIAFKTQYAQLRRRQSETFLKRSVKHPPYIAIHTTYAHFPPIQQTDYCPRFVVHCSAIVKFCWNMFPFRFGYCHACGVVSESSSRFNCAFCAVRIVVQHISIYTDTHICICLLKSALASEMALWNASVCD